MRRERDIAPSLREGFLSTHAEHRPYIREGFGKKKKKKSIGSPIREGFLEPLSRSEIDLP